MSLPKRYKVADLWTNVSIIKKTKTKHAMEKHNLCMIKYAFTFSSQQKKYAGASLAHWIEKVT